MMQDGGTDRAPLDRVQGSSTEPNQLGHALRRTGLNCLLATFLQQRGCSCFITWSVVMGPMAPDLFPYECMVCIANVDFLNGL
jgi:hypothetical protein